MKKNLFIMLAAAVLCSCEEDSKLNPNLFPKEEEEVWVETGDISVRRIIQEDAEGPAVVMLDLRIKGYTLSQYGEVRLVTKSGTPLYLYHKTEQAMTMVTAGVNQNDDSSWSFYVPVLPQSGEFDFVMELPASEQNTVVKLPRSFRTKVWRITMSQADGVWSVADLSLVPGQE